MDSLLEQIQEWFSLLGPNRYLQAGVVVVISYVAAKIIEKIVFALIGRWTRHTRTDIDDRLLALVRRPVVVTCVLVGLIVATHRLELEEGPEGVTLGVVETLIILVWLVFGIRFSRLVLTILSRFEDRFELVQARTLPLFENLAYVVIIGGTTYFVFLAWNIDVTAWLASAGIIGIAVSFAAKDTLANLFAGVFILADAPYKLGDFIVLDSGERGRVTQIGLRSTRLLTRDDIEITIPNAVLGNSKIINESGGPHEKERIRIRITVAYGSDIDQVRDVLLEVAGSHSEICRDPEPRVRFREFGSSGLILELLCWIDEPVLRGRLVDAMNGEVYKTFLARSIEIPYLKQDIYVKELPRHDS